MRGDIGHWLLKLFTGSLIVLATHSAYAMTSDRQRALDLFAEGNKAFADGQLKRARNLYTRAFSMSRSFDIACNLGRAEAELGEYAAAAEHLDYCLRNYSASARTEVREAEVKLRALEREVLTRVGTLDLVVEGSVVGTFLSVGSRRLGEPPFPRTIFVEPGEHVIRITRPGQPHVERRVDVVAGQDRQITIRIPRAEEHSSTATASESTDTSSTMDPPGLAADTGGGGVSDYKLPVLIGTGSLALISVGVGVYGLVRDRALQDEAASLRGDLAGEEGPSACYGDDADARCGEIREKLDSSDQANTLGFGGLVAGGVLAAGTVAAWFLWPEASGDGDTASPAIRAVPVIAPGGKGTFLGTTLQASF